MITVLFKLSRRRSSAVVFRALTKSTREAHSIFASMMNAVAKIIATYRDLLNDELFKEKLGMISAKSLMRTAKERGGRSIGLAEVMVLEYNGKKKNSAFKLNIQRLYDKSIPFWSCSFERNFYPSTCSD